jgi:DNA-binding response OmpR family regulator
MPTVLRVLLVDDTPQIAELLTFGLRDRGYEVINSGYVFDIENLAADRQVHAVVLDCSVYDASESLFDTLRGDSRHEELPVVIVTDTPDERSGREPPGASRPARPAGAQAVYGRAGRKCARSAPRG